MIDLPDDLLMLVLCVEPKRLADPARWCSELRELVVGPARPINCLLEPRSAFRSMLSPSGRKGCAMRLTIAVILLVGCASISIAQPAVPELSTAEQAATAAENAAGPGRQEPGVTSPPSASVAPVPTLSHDSPAPAASPAAEDASTPTAPIADATSAQAKTRDDANGPPPDEFRPPAGYRTVKRGDQTVYCTTIKPIGSNLTKTACMTEAQLEEVERRMQSIRREMDEQLTKCAVTAGSCGGG